jgi:hypothetical protein
MAEAALRAASLLQTTGDMRRPGGVTLIVPVRRITADKVPPALRRSRRLGLNI